MENKKGNGIFLSVIGVATLIVAIIGATFAYFSATASSNNEAIAVNSATLSLGYKDITTGLKTNMIPSEESIAEYAAFTEAWVNQEEVSYEVKEDKNQDGDTDDEGETTTVKVNGKGQCIDDNGNEICSVYEFYIGNPSTTTNMSVQGTLTVVKNEFENLKFTIYDEAGDPIVSDKFPATDGTLRLSAMDQELIAYAGVANRTGVIDFSKKGPEETMLDYNAEDPSTYQPSIDKSLSTNADTTTNVRHYTMLIWVDETTGDQTKADSGKSFTAGISFKTGGAGGGVTGIIAAAG